MSTMNRSVESWVPKQTGTTYTLSAADDGRVITFNNASPVAVTLPQQSTTELPEGFSCVLRNRGAGQVTIGTEGSDSFESLSSNTKLNQHGTATVIVETAGTPNTWLGYGDLVA